MRSKHATECEMDVHEHTTNLTLRHYMVARLLVSGKDNRTIQELLGHKDLKPTMICTHIVNRGGRELPVPWTP